MMSDESALLEENRPTLEEEDTEGLVLPVNLDELSFSWFLMKVVQGVQNFCRPDNTFFKRKYRSYHVHLVLTCIIFIVGIIVGSIYLNDCSNERMICIFLIVQGVCGLFVVLVHITAAFAE